MVQYKCVDGVIIELTENDYNYHTENLENIKAIKLGEISMRFELDMGEVKTSYTESEIMSWSKQETEARAYVANSAAPTPLLSSIAASRGVPLGILATRVIEKSEIFATISGTLIGKRQKLEDMINAATIETINAISWDSV